MRPQLRRAARRPQLNDARSLYLDYPEVNYDTFTAEYNDNNVIRIVKAGDVTICPTGQGHGIANKTDEVVELVAVIVYA